MRVPAALLFFPLVVGLAQPSPQTPAQPSGPAPPPYVDQALRARVNEFFQDHVEGKFSKAYEMVAEDTKEYYFATQKIQFKSFKLESIKYSDDFTKAEVDLTGQRVWKPRYDFPDTLVTITMHTTWKIEEGKWVWYDHTRPTWITPFGPSDTAALQPHDTPKDGSPDLSPGALQQRASAILQQQPALDKSELMFQSDKSSSEQVVFHNSQQGVVKLYVDQSSMPAGFTAELDKSDIGAGENAVVKIHFDPKDAAASLAPFSLRLVMEPFDKIFRIAVKFAPRQPAP